MTDSPTNARSGDSAFDVGTVEDLFGDLDEETPDPDDGAGADDEPESETSVLDEDVEDRTAATVFGELRESVDDSTDSTDVLDESPEEIIASADEPVVEPEPIDDDLVDEGALADLLLTDRTKGEEFLWIETDDGEADDVSDAEGADGISDADGEAPAPSSPVADADPADADRTATATDAAEVESEPEPAPGSPPASAADATDAPGSNDIEPDDTLEDDDPDTDVDEFPADRMAEDAADPASSGDGSDDDPAESSGIVGWLRSKLGRLL